MRSPFRTPTFPPDEGVLTSLWRDAFDGDLQAREEFCHLMWPLLLLWARRRLKNREDAEDVAQEVCPKLLRTRYDPRKGSFFALAYTVTDRVALGFLRRRRGGVALDGVSLADPHPDPADEAAARDERDQLGRLVAGLDAEDRNVLKLRFEDGRKLREMARDLNVRQGSVGRRLYGALSAIRRLWERRKPA